MNNYHITLDLDLDLAYSVEDSHQQFWTAICNFLQLYINPNKAGLFEGSFPGEGGQFDPPLPYFKKNLSNINITFIKLLNNLFKIC